MPLGVVTHAERAHVGTAATSLGSTIYEGDRLDTDIGGALRVIGSGVILQLDGQSSLLVRRSADPGSNIVAELKSGTLVFSARPTCNIAIVADDASIHPVGNAATVAHVRVVNSKELLISAQRGAVKFSYHGESEVITEGKAYRVLLDPSEKEIVAALGPNQDKKPPARRRRVFLLLEIAIPLAILIPVIIRILESPDRPGSKVPAPAKP